MTKILIPIEDKRFAAAQVEFLSKHKLPPDTQFTLLTLIEPLVVQDFGGALPYTYIANLAEEDLLYSKQLLADTESDLRKYFPDAQIEQKSENAAPANAIINFAKTGKFDWIVMGSHGRSGLERLLLGSVSQKVVNHAPSSVTIVRLPRAIEPASEKEGLVAGLVKK